MKNLIWYLVFLIVGLVIGSLFLRCPAKTKSNETDNIDKATDSLEIIKQQALPLQGQVAQKEVIIADLSRVLAELRAENAKGGLLAGKLVERLKRAQDELATQNLELNKLMILLAETKIGPIDSPIVEIGEDGQKVYSTRSIEPNGWYNIYTTMNIDSMVATHEVSVLNDFDVSQFIDNGVSKFRVTNRNPYTVTKAGTNIFDLKPTITVVPKKKRVGLGLICGYGAGKNGLTPFLGIGLSYNILRF